MGERISYRPSNGTEGDCFQARWCAKCERERLYRESNGEAEGCSILCDTMAYSIDDPSYPMEWRKDGQSGPRCTAFIAEGDDTPPPIDPAAVVRPLL